MKLLFIFSIVTVLGHVSYAQTFDTIRTGRPGQSIGPYVVGTGYFQVQSGLDFNSADMGSSTSRSQVSNNVIRYGLSESLELSALVNVQKDRETPSGVEHDGLSDLHVGFRYNIIDHPEGWIPGFGIQTRFRTTNVSREYRTDHLAPLIIFVTNHRLNETFAWVNNFSISYDGITPIPKYTVISNLSFSLNDHWGSYVELYAVTKDEYGSVYGDSGVSYLVNKDLQLDVFAGYGNNRGVTDTFISVGISWRKQTRTTMEVAHGI